MCIRDSNYFKYIHASWLSPIIAIALAFGVLAGVLTWVAGPSKGIFAVGKAGYMPPFFQKTNKLGVQKNILFVQGIAVTVLSPVSYTHLRVPRLQRSTVQLFADR